MKRASFGQMATSQPQPQQGQVSGGEAPSPTISGVAATAAQTANAMSINVTDTFLDNPTLVHTPLIIPPPGMPLPSMESMQLKNIRTPHPNDVLCGRGGGTNNHAGNEKFRQLVNQQKVRYLNSAKRDKPFVSKGIVRAVRGQIPPGRFLQKNESTGFWYDIGDLKARDKTSQALREGAPDIRREFHNTVSMAGPRPQPRLVFGPTGAPTGASSLSSPPPMAAALIHARTIPPGTTAQGTFDGLDMERHMQSVRMAEAAIDKNALAVVAAAAVEKSASEKSDSLASPSMNRAMSNQDGGLPGTKGSADDASLNGGTEVTTNIQQAVAASAAAATVAMPPSNVPQLRQSALMADARSNLLNPLGNDPVRMAAAVRAASAGFSPFPVLGPNGAPVATGGPQNLMPFGSNLVAAARASGFNSYLGGVVPGANLGPSLGASSSTLSTVNPPAAQVPKLFASSSRTLGLGGEQPGPSPVVFDSQPSMFDSSGNHRFGNMGSGGVKAPPLTEDMAMRLVFAETVSQKTANGTISQAITAVDNRLGFYLQAGMLGIDPEEMTKLLEEGLSEQEIVERHYDLAAKKLIEAKPSDNSQVSKGGEEETNGTKDSENETSESSEKGEKGDEPGEDDRDKETDKKAREEQEPSAGEESKEPARKKAKFVLWQPDPEKCHGQSEKRIHDALVCIGAQN